VTSDLSGVLDSWTLEGDEDLTLGDDQTADNSGESPATESDDDDDESHPTLIFGQRWISNPSAMALPKLPSTPAVLSFRPAGSYASTAPVHGFLGTYAVREDHDSGSHDPSQREDRLLVVTSRQEVYEYRILEGKFSDWSRRNPPSTFPEEFKIVRDHAMDCVWDISGERERVWIYGSSWLWMFDMSKDLAGEAETEAGEAYRQPASHSAAMAGKKRKRNDRPTACQLMKHTSGAGGRIPDHRPGGGIGSSIRTTVGAKQRHPWTRLEPGRSRASDESDDDVDSDLATTTDLVRLRRAGGGDRPNGTGDGHLLGEGAGPHANDGGDGTATRADAGAEARSHWHTYKYRPILGIVPLGSGDGEGERGPGIEVALVERPLWEVDLPARWEGNQEWAT
jgi:U3 small nucleolar RNA-associated protein 4